MKKRHFFLGARMEIITLNQTFYERHSEHSEILHNKDGRPYLALIIQSEEYTFAIPFRTSGHQSKNSPKKPKLGYFFSSSGRKSISAKGKIPTLDYVKAVIITEMDIAGTGRIDANEFRELHDNFEKIRNDFFQYVKYYKDSIRSQVNLNDFEIRCSTLQYFHKELSL